MSRHRGCLPAVPKSAPGPDIRAELHGDSDVIRYAVLRDVALEPAQQRGIRDRNQQT
jgi:hypothetical protein